LSSNIVHCTLFIINRSLFIETEMKRLWLSILTLALTGCIENDIPYPVVECVIKSIAAEGLSGDPIIDRATRTVTLPLEETTDIQNVVITACEITEEATASQEIEGRHNLMAPLYVTLSIYQDYPWTIQAQQIIPRIFTVAGQVGATEWDLADRTAKVYVGFEDLSHVEITGLKLGPVGAGMSGTDIDELDESNFHLLSDFTTPNPVYVTCHGRTETWHLSVEHTDIKVAFAGIAPWTHSAWLRADGLNGTKLGFRYREEGSEEWIEAAEESITIDGGSFSTQLRGLVPETRYQAIAYSNDDVSPIESFTTEAALPLPNGGFEAWSQPGKIIYPYAEGAQPFWDSGNKGSATVNKIVCEGRPEPRPGSDGTKSAYLESTFAAVAGIGKFAAGNIFVGTYTETIGTNGKINFGRPFATHPIALRGWVKYTQGQIDIDLSKVTMPPGQTLTEGDPDMGAIYIVMGAWTAAEYGGTDESPLQIYTKDLNTFFDKNGKDVIGYGELLLNETVGDWRQITIPIEWRDTQRTPTHMMIVCSASRWGDYFIGSTKSRMWLDDFELIYDYADL